MDTNPDHRPGWIGYPNQPNAHPSQWWTYAWAPDRPTSNPGWVMRDAHHQYWVENADAHAAISGYETPSAACVGPFDTWEEAAATFCLMYP